MTFDRELKLAIVQVIANSDILGYLSERQKLIPCLMQTWQLETIASGDERYSNKEQEIIQHFYNNSDWTPFELIETQLGVVSLSDEKFQIFIESIVNGDYYSTQSRIQQERIVSLLEIPLKTRRLGLYIKSYSASTLMPQYGIAELGTTINTLSEFTNSIPFFVSPNISGRTDARYKIDDSIPAPWFQLVSDSFDDNRYVTRFRLFYKGSDDRVVDYVGILKIITKGTLSSGEYYYVKEELPPQFYQLDTNQFCSVGADIDYYKKIKALFPDYWMSVLHALSDAAFFPGIKKVFQETEQWKLSINRAEYSDCARMSREARYLVDGRERDSFYNFLYRYKYNKMGDVIDVNFRFSTNGIIRHRLIAFIGKNGCGKTRLLTSLPKQFAVRDTSSFFPEIPLFAKTIALSTSYFDNFETPEPNERFSYVYCGLSQRIEGRRIVMDPLQQVERISQSCASIKGKNRLDDLAHIMSGVLPKDVFDQIFITDGYFYDVSIDGLNRTFPDMSSGESILLFMFAQLIDEIEHDSLIILDEPETHLHPNAITHLISSIYYLLDKFQSFAILATHSPLVIRDILADDVFVLERNTDMLSIRKIGAQSFGANLSSLTDMIFGGSRELCYYSKQLRKLVEQGNIQAIVETLENNGLIPDIGVYMYLQALEMEKIRGRNEKN